MLKYLKKIDIFGTKVELFYDQGSSFKSSFSGFFSLALIVIMVTLVGNKFMALVKRENKSVNEINKFLPSDGRIPMNRQNFMVAMGFSDTSFNNASGNNYVSINLTWRNNLRNSTTGETKKVRKPIELVPCTIDDHFPNLDSYFISLNLQNYLCPKNNTEASLFLSGTYTDDSFQFFEIKLFNCSSAFRNDCTSEGNMTSFLKSSLSRLKFQMFISTNVIQAEDEKNLLNKSIIGEFHWLIDPEDGVYRTADIFIKEMRFKSYPNIILPSKDVEEVSTFNYAGDIREQVTFNNQAVNGEISSFYFRKSLFITEIERKYWSFEEFFVYLGGIWSPLFFIFFFIGNRYNKKKLLFRLMNRLYKFQLHQPSFKHKTQEEGPMEFMTKREHLKLGFFESTIRFLCCWWRKGRLHLKEKRRLISKGKESIAKDLDLVNILQSMQEFEKLKKIIFENNELVLLNFSPRCKITLSETDQMMGRATRLASEGNLIIPNIEKRSLGPKLRSLVQKKHSYQEQRSRLLEDKGNMDTSKSLMKLIKSYIEVKNKISKASEVKSQLLSRLVKFVENELKFLKGMEKFTTNQLEEIYKTRTLSELDGKYREFMRETVLQQDSMKNKEGSNIEIDAGLISPNMVNLPLLAKPSNESENINEEEKAQASSTPNEMETYSNREF